MVYCSAEFPFSGKCAKCTDFTLVCFMGKSYKSADGEQHYQVYICLRQGKVVPVGFTPDGSFLDVQVVEKDG